MKYNNDTITSPSGFISSYLALSILFNEEVFRIIIPATTKDIEAAKKAET